MKVIYFKFTREAIPNHGGEEYAAKWLRNELRKSGFIFAREDEPAKFSDVWNALAEPWEVSRSSLCDEHLITQQQPEKTT